MHLAIIIFLFYVLYQGIKAHISWMFSLTVSQFSYTKRAFFLGKDSTMHNSPGFTQNLESHQMQGWKSVKTTVWEMKLGGTVVISLILCFVSRNKAQVSWIFSLTLPQLSYTKRASFMGKASTMHSSPRLTQNLESHQKSDNLQYNMLSCWVAGMIV